MWALNRLIEMLPWKRQRAFYEELEARRRVSWEVVRGVLDSIRNSWKAGDPTTGWDRIHEKVKRESLARWKPKKRAWMFGAALQSWGPRAARFFVIRV